MQLDSMEYVFEEGIDTVLNVWLTMLGSNLVSGALGIAAYVLMSLGLYTIAQRRGIKNPWMAWVPVLNLWILGSIADQYRYVVRGEVRSRRKVLIVLAILQAVAVIALFVMLISMMVNIMMRLPELERMTEDQALKFVLSSVLPMVGALLVMLVVSIVTTVFEYVAYYDLFASCDPENKVLFLVLGILFSVTLPFFVFACRKKDRGMPPRRVQQPASVVPPMAEQPLHREPEELAYREPEEPWVDSEE